MPRLSLRLFGGGWLDILQQCILATTDDIFGLLKRPHFDVVGYNRQRRRRREEGETNANPCICVCAHCIFIYGKMHHYHSWFFLLLLFNITMFSTRKISYSFWISSYCLHCVFGELDYQYNDVILSLTDRVFCRIKTNSHICSLYCVVDAFETFFNNFCSEEPSFLFYIVVYFERNATM